METKIEMESNTQMESNPQIQKEDQRELTFGEKLVGLTFNPSGDPKVLKAKQLCAELADLLFQNTPPTHPASLEQLLIDKAIGDILDAQMNVVKALTLKY